MGQKYGNYSMISWYTLVHFVVQNVFNENI